MDGQRRSSAPSPRPSHHRTLQLCRQIARRMENSCNVFGSPRRPSYSVGVPNFSLVCQKSYYSTLFQGFFGRSMEVHWSPVKTSYRRLTLSAVRFPSLVWKEAIQAITHARLSTLLLLIGSLLNWWLMVRYFFWALELGQRDIFLICNSWHFTKFYPSTADFLPKLTPFNSWFWVFHSFTLKWRKLGWLNWCWKSCSICPLCMLWSVKGLSNNWQRP